MRWGTGFDIRKSKVALPNRFSPSSERCFDFLPLQEGYGVSGKEFWIWRMTRS
jgi:hypothetical protein